MVKVRAKEEVVSKLVKMAAVELRVEQAGVQEVTPLTIDGVVTEPKTEGKVMIT